MHIAHRMSALFAMLVLCNSVACAKKSAGSGVAGEPGSQCYEHRHCGATELCDRGFCIETVPCQSASDCASGMRCDKDLKACCHEYLDLCI